MLPVIPTTINYGIILLTMSCFFSFTEVDTPIYIIHMICKYMIKGIKVGQELLGVFCLVDNKSVILIPKPN